MHTQPTMHGSDAQFAMRCHAAHYAGATRDIERLEDLPAGAHICTADHKMLVRTTNACICFCDITSGQLYSAKDVVYRFGGAAGMQA